MGYRQCKKGRTESWNIGMMIPEDREQRTDDPGEIHFALGFHRAREKGQGEKGRKRENGSIIIWSNRILE